MREYEVRIYDQSGKLALTYKAAHLSDIDAIEAAQRHRRNSDMAEVWCGDICVSDLPTARFG
jgi:hypothetical protein